METSNASKGDKFGGYIPLGPIWGYGRATWVSGVEYQTKL